MMIMFYFICFVLFCFTSVSKVPHCLTEVCAVVEKALIHRRPSDFVSQMTSFKWSLNEGIHWPGCQILTMAVDVTYWQSCNWCGSSPPLYCVVIC